MSLIPHVFGDLLSNLTPSSDQPSSFPIDWKETPEAHVIKADLPGLKKQDVTIEIEDGRILQISGERKEEEVTKEKEDKEKGERWRRVERPRGKLMRRFRLPENAKPDEAKATMEDGVLTIVVPKQEPKKPEVKTIKISG